MFQYCMYYTYKIFFTASIKTQQYTIIPSLDLALVPLSGAMLIVNIGVKVFLTVKKYIIANLTVLLMTLLV